MDEFITVLVRFKVWGRGRFLSHAETLRMFQRACVRAEIDVAHSQGFNPRPKMSLPLPRSVGVESDDELFCFRLGCSGAEFDAERIKEGLGRELPGGFEVFSVDFVTGKVNVEAEIVSYEIRAKMEFVGAELEGRIKVLLSGEPVVVERRINDRGMTKKRDVSCFLKSIILKDDGLIEAKCRNGAAGSVRIDELLQLLGLGYDKVAGAVKRVSVEWSGLN